MGIFVVVQTESPKRESRIFFGIMHNQTGGAQYVVVHFFVSFIHNENTWGKKATRMHSLGAGKLLLDLGGRSSSPCSLDGIQECSFSVACVVFGRVHVFNASIDERPDDATTVTFEELPASMLR